MPERIIPVLSGTHSQAGESRSQQKPASEPTSSQICRLTRICAHEDVLTPRCPLALLTISQSTLNFYENENAVVATSKQYHDNAAKRFFSARVKGHSTWGVFDNEIGGH